MANADAPFGLRPIKVHGSPWNGQAELYYIPSGDTDDFYIGKPVTLAGSADSNGIPSVSKHTAGSGLIGAIVGIQDVQPGLASQQGTGLDKELMYIPATKSKDYYVFVTDDPSVVYEIQEDSVGGALAATDVGLNANIADADPSNTAQNDASELDSSSAATTVSLDLKILRLKQAPNNAIGTNAVWEVKICNHVLANNHVGID